MVYEHSAATSSLLRYRLISQALWLVSLPDQQYTVRQRVAQGLVIRKLKFIMPAHPRDVLRLRCGWYKTFRQALQLP